MNYLAKLLTDEGEISANENEEPTYFKVLSKIKQKIILAILRANQILPIFINK